MTSETQKIDERIHYLYRITNKINGKIYIGQTVEPTKRWYQHRRDAAHPTMAIHYAINKYGAHNFEFEVIASCKTWDNVNELETLLVAQYDCLTINGKGYNIALGGMNAPKSDAWKQAMRDHWTNDLREEKSQFMREFIANKSPEEKEKIANLLSKILKGRHLSPNSEFKLNHTVSEDTKNKISKANSGKHNSPKTEFKPGHKNTDPTILNSNKIVKNSNNGQFKSGQIPWNKGLHINNVGTFPSGEQHPNAKINEIQVLEIIKLYKSGMKKMDISKTLEISKDTVYDILKGRTWSHITGIKN